MANTGTEGPEIAGIVKMQEGPAKAESVQPEAEVGQRDEGASVEAGADESDTGPGQNGDTGLSSSADGSEADAKTHANRENARKSTGPRTEAGRAASSQNAVKHGLFAQDLSKYFRGEEFERYQLFINGIVGDLKPVGDFETVLARRAADIQFRLEMLRNAEFLEYSGGGIVANSMAAHISKHRDPMGLVSLYDSRFQRSFKTTMDELRKLQQTRKDEEKRTIEDLKAIAKAHIQQNADFDPITFGFVISRDLVLNKVHLDNARILAQHAIGDGIVEKKVVAYVTGLPKKAA